MKNRTCSICGYEMSSWNALRRTLNYVKCPNCGQKNKLNSSANIFLTIGMLVVLIVLFRNNVDSLTISYFTMGFMIFSLLLEAWLFDLQVESE